MNAMKARALFVGIALATVGVAACTSDQVQTPVSAVQDGTGTIGLELQAAPGVSISKVNWTIHNPALLAADLTGSVDVSHSQAIQFVVGGLPAGPGYTIALTASTDGPNPLSCVGSGTFSIIANATSPVMVALVCSGPVVDAGSNGSVSVIVTPQIPPLCASVTSLSASPSTVDVGWSLELATSGIDFTGSTATVGFSWAVTGGTGAGTFSSTTSATPTFTCTSAGGVTVTVTAAIPGGATCTNNTMSIALTCTTPGGGGGTPDASAAETSSAAPDTGAVPDAGSPDAGVPDAAQVRDTGTPDLGAPETGSAEAAAPDTGAVEAGAPDTGTPDVGTAEAGAVDTGTTDTGTADAGSHEAATADTGVDTGSTPDAGALDSGAGDTSTADAGTQDLCNPANPKTTTLTCMQQQDNAPHSTPPTPTTLCSTCVVANNCFDPVQAGGSCELTPGPATLFSGTLPDGKTCAQVFSPLTAPISERAACLQVLDQIFTSTCAATLQETPCLCGATDPGSCQAGTATPTGPVYDTYACDFNSANGATITTDFTLPQFGAGQANSLIQCAAAFTCDCF